MTDYTPAKMAWQNLQQAFDDARQATMAHFSDDPPQYSRAPVEGFISLLNDLTLAPSFEAELARINIALDETALTLFRRSATMLAELSEPVRLAVEQVYVALAAYNHALEDLITPTAYQTMATYFDEDLREALAEFHCDTLTTVLIRQSEEGTQILMSDGNWAAYDPAADAMTEALAPIPADRVGHLIPEISRQIMFG